MYGFFLFEKEDKYDRQKGRNGDEDGMMAFGLTKSNTSLVALQNNLKPFLKQRTREKINKRKVFQELKNTQPKKRYVIKTVCIDY